MSISKDPSDPSWSPRDSLDTCHPSTWASVRSCLQRKQTVCSCPVVHGCCKAMSFPLVSKREAAGRTQLWACLFPGDENESLLGFPLAPVETDVCSWVDTVWLFCSLIQFSGCLKVHKNFPGGLETQPKGIPFIHNLSVLPVSNEKGTRCNMSKSLLRQAGLGEEGCVCMSVPALWVQRHRSVKG